MRIDFVPRAIASAVLVSAALLFGPAAAAFAVPGVQSNLPTPEPAATNTTEVGKKKGEDGKEPALTPEEKGPPPEKAPATPAVPVTCK